MALLRTDEWLKQLLDEIWTTYFHDIQRANDVTVEFARGWKSRLGLIRMTESQARTYIGINGLLRHPSAPEFVVMVTTAHELCHYAHGFGSPLPQRHQHPHAGNVVGRELQERGLGALLADYDTWVAEFWHDYYDQRIAELGLQRRSKAAAHTRAAAAAATPR
jgi:hypothetical protein